MIGAAGFTSGLAFGLSIGFVGGVGFIIGVEWLLVKLVFLATRNP